MATGPGAASAVQRTTTSAFAGREVVVVDPAATGVGAPRAVPGLTRFPAPGRAHLSPALAELVREHPTELATRSGPLAGQLGGQAAQYRSLAVIAITLIVVPLLVLAGAASRLGLARRDQRLAALRLAGATPRQVVVLTALESAFTAAAGAALGAAGAVLLVPLAAQVPVAGGRWYAADLVPVLAGVLAGVIALALASAVSALRRVLTSALGVAAAHTPRRTGPIRVVVSAALLLAFLRYSESDDPSTGALVGAFATVFAALAVLGPWVVATLGRLVVHRAKGALALLAGRRMLDDSRGTWRVVGPVALTGFVAGALALFPTGSEEVTWPRPACWTAAAPTASSR